VNFYLSFEKVAKITHKTICKPFDRMSCELPFVE